MKKEITVLIFVLFSCISNAQEVLINNNLVIETDGTVRMDSSATVWDDLRVVLLKGEADPSMDYLSGSSGPEILYFRNTETVEAMSFIVQLPHSWKEGTNIYPHIHWIPRNSGTGDVEWNLDYTWANYNATTPQVFPTIATLTTVTSGPFTASTHLITKLTPSNAGIDGTGKTVSSILICRIWRDSSSPTDTYNDDAGTLMLDFHFEMDTFGSRAEYSK